MIKAVIAKFADPPHLHRRPDAFCRHHQDLRRGECRANRRSSGLHERELPLRGVPQGSNLVGPSVAGARLLRVARNDSRF
jgi:hypothetical protein